MLKIDVIFVVENIAVGREITRIQLLKSVQRRRQAHVRTALEVSCLEDILIPKCPTRLRCMANW